MVFSVSASHVNNTYGCFFGYICRSVAGFFFAVGRSDNTLPNSCGKPVTGDFNVSI